MLSAGAVVAQSNALSWHGIVGGGGTGQAGGWVLSGTIGQSLATGAGGAVVGGFWVQGLNAGVTSNTTAALAVSSLTEAPAAGSDSVFLITTNQSVNWNAAANASWLHLGVASQSGTGSAKVIFSFDSNPGSVRNGTITLAGQILTVTQAGTNYVLASPLTTLVSSGLNIPRLVAVDRAGNIYIADLNNNAIKKWSAAGNTVSTLVSSGIGTPFGVAVDGSGNVFFSDQSNTAIKEWVASSGTVTTLVSSGLTSPKGVAVDQAGNVYFADSSASNLKKWVATNGTVVTVVASGLSAPRGLAVDGAGNVYIADTGNAAIKVWSAASQSVTTLIASGLTAPYGVAVDGGGNVFIADGSANAIKKWSVAGNALSTAVASGLSAPYGVAVDAADNVYIGDSSDNAIKELPRAFVNPSAVTEAAAAGADVLPAVLPLSENLAAPFAPVVDASGSGWLTLGGVSGGVVGFVFTANTVSNRTAHITVLGQSIAITQNASQGAVLSALSTAVYGTNQLFGAPSIAITADNRVALKFSGQPGSQYGLQRSVDLRTWNTIWITNVPLSGNFSYTDGFGDFNGQAPSTAFYRLVWNSQ